MCKQHTPPPLTAAAVIVAQTADERAARLRPQQRNDRIHAQQ